jgi:hypothetical protein
MFFEISEEDRFPVKIKYKPLILKTTAMEIILCFLKMFMAMQTEADGEI